MSRKKKLAVLLIQDDLVNSKLLYSLEKMEMTPSSYYLNLSESILKIMKFKKKRREKAFTKYVTLKENHMKRKFLGDSKKIKKFAKTIYKKLIAQK